MAIWARLEQSDSSFAQETLKTLSKNSPLSLCVIFEALKRGENLSLEQAYQMEIQLTTALMEDGDFNEGVRALLVDKDNSPKWAHKSLAEVDSNVVSAFFEKDVQKLDFKL